MWRRQVALAALCAGALSACGGGAPATVKAPFTYGPTPSVSARMICRPETVHDIRHVLGERTISAPVSSWANHRYSCPYVYVNATMTLFVKELPSLAATSAYMAALRRTMGDTGGISNLGQVGFTTTNGSAVTKKDNKVLVVDVGGLPGNFGHPATTRDEVALTVTDIILQCWRGN